jgi:hypothetical protein
VNLSPEGNKAADATSGTPIGPEPVIGALASTLVIAAPLEPIGWFGKTLKLFGPGLITGAADDDPSGIATYSSVGAQFGNSMLWTMPLIYPFMAAVQERIFGRPPISLMVRRGGSKDRKTFQNWAACEMWRRMPRCAICDRHQHAKLS